VAHAAASGRAILPVRTTLSSSATFGSDRVWVAQAMNIHDNTGMKPYLATNL
jgi:hypothetical protein